MLFNSLDFVAFFAVVLAVSTLLRGAATLQKLFLLAASYWFYGQWSWTYLGLILASTAVDYSIGLGMVKVRRPGTLMTVSVIVNLVFLGFFKYANWLIGNLNGASAALGSAFALSPLDIVLPVGISFYTFQSLSYTIDVYRGISPPRRNLLDYALFVAFFPQLLSGPIVRDTEFFHQLDRERRVDFATVQRALALIAFGYLKKVVLADNLAPLVDAVYAHPAGQDGWSALAATYAFALQIYFDFSGYTDIAIGCAALLGFEYPKNFDHPYGAITVQAFWRRWHMTLSRWLRDYLYIALGGNRHGVTRTYAALIVTMLLGGLWHGASWNFVVWGGLHGLYLAGERWLAPRLPGMNEPTLWPARLLRWLVTFHLVCFAWVFFRAPDFATASTLLSAIATIRTLPPEAAQAILLPAALLLAIHAASGRFDFAGRVATSRGPLFVAVTTGVLLALIWFTPNRTVPFIYFQF